MEKMDLLNLPQAEAAALQKRLNKLVAFTGIKIDILDLKDNILTVRVEQIDLKNGWILNQDELSYRAKDIFRDFPQFKVHYITLTYQPKFESITKEWIKSKMKEFNLKQTDVIKHLGLDKSTLSSLLNDETKTVTRFQKSAFYFYFLNFELNKNFREHLSAMEEAIQAKSITGDIQEAELCQAEKSSAAVMIIGDDELELHTLSDNYKVFQFTDRLCQVGVTGFQGDVICANQVFPPVKTVKINQIGRSFANLNNVMIGIRQAKIPADVYVCKIPKKERAEKKEK